MKAWLLFYEAHYGSCVEEGLSGGNVAYGADSNDPDKKQRFSEGVGVVVRRALIPNIQYFLSIGFPGSLIGGEGEESRMPPRFLLQQLEQRWKLRGEG